MNAETKIDKCAFCKKLVAATLGKIIKKGIAADCGELAGEFGGACDATGWGPENPLADAICTAAADIIYTECNHLGWEWIKNNVDEAAEIICKKLGYCSS